MQQTITTTLPSSSQPSSKKRPMTWTKEEDSILIQKTKEHNYKNWAAVASFIPGRTAIQCSARYKRIQPGLIKGAWTPEEDLELLRLYKYYGKNWSNISRSMPQRTGKQIRDRFLNALDSNLKKEKFSIDEDKKVLKWYKVYGNAWCKIAKKIKGRTGDMVKNRFYSSLKNYIGEYNEEDEGKDNEEGMMLKKKRKYCKRKKGDGNDSKEGGEVIVKKKGRKRKKGDFVTNSEEECKKNVNNVNNIECDVNISNDKGNIQKPNKYFYTTTHITNQQIPIMNVQYAPIGSSIEDNDNYVISHNKNNSNASILKYREPIITSMKMHEHTEHNSSFQSKSEILKNLLQSQMTNGVRKDNLVKQLEILKELKTITKERINAFSTS